MLPNDDEGVLSDARENETLQFFSAFNQINWILIQLEVKK